jgi:glycosyltransferase involved in cell wall biosynthesis
MFSLIIPAYNEEKYIWPCLDFALKNADGLIDEIIVVDNASTDKTYAIASDYAKKYPIITVVKEPAKWLTKARQRWYMEARWDILGYIDADTQMPLGWTRKVLYEFENNEKVWVVSGPYEYYDLPRYKQVTNALYNRFISYPTYLCIWYVVWGGNFAIRRSVLEKINGFDTNIAFYGEDTDLGRRASKHCKVKFMLRIAMPTSGRRFVWQWTLKTFWVYLINFLSQAIKHKPATSKYEDYR